MTSRKDKVSTKVQSSVPTVIVEERKTSKADSRIILSVMPQEEEEETTPQKL